MTDYYEELSLSRKLDTNQIQEELVRLESLWRKREVNSPEKANKMLGLVMDAQKVFASESSRRKYDNNLEASRREPEDPDILRSKSLEKCTNQARAFYNDGQYDLAKVAIEKAISLSNINGDDDALFALAADIYKDNDDLDIAMTYINRAIVAAPDVSTYYLSKGLIYDQQASVAMQYGGYGNPVNFRLEARKMFQLADTKAEQSGDLTNRARACGAIAFSFYFQDPMDKKAGEDFANLSVKFGGDSWGNADKVLKEINIIREEARRKELEKENARKEGIYSEAIRIAETREISELERAISKFETIFDYKDSAQQIENLVTKIQREKQAKIKKRKMSIKAILIAIPVVVVVIVVGMFSHNIQHHKCGENLKWNYNTETKTLTISGTGAMFDYDYRYSKTPWGSDSLLGVIEMVVIEGGCTYIGEDAFKSAYNLKSVYIPETVTTIGWHAFEGCSNLVEVNIPLDITVLPEIFGGCGFVFVNVPAHIVEIGPRAYSDCWKLEIVYIPDGVEKIDSYAFTDCYNLRDITIPQSVTSISQNAFQSCKEDAIIHYSGTKDQWLSFASHIFFAGVVECSDSDYRYN